MPRFTFFLVATFVIWLAICLPLAILTSWLFGISSFTAASSSAVAALPLTIFMWFTIQSSSAKLKWPVVQLLGLTTILISVLLVASPLHLFFEAVTVGMWALVLWAATSLYAVYTALTIRNVPLEIRSHKIVNHCRLVHLSDLHAGSRSRRFLEKSVKQSLSHQPDAVLITGDLLDSSVVDAEFLAPLSALSCPVWMSLGNHERYVQLDSAIAAIEQQNVTILRNQSVDFNQLHIIGIDDTDNPAQAAQELSALQNPGNKFSVLLYHRPDGWDAACEQNVDLTLAGHTHAGQIWPFGILVKRQFPNMAGYFSKGTSHLFVSQGTGTWGPTMRLGTQSEMTVIDLLPSES